MLRNIYRVTGFLENAAAGRNIPIRQKCLARASCATKWREGHFPHRWCVASSPRLRSGMFVLSGVLSFLGLKENIPEEPELIMALKWSVFYMQRVCIFCVKRNQYEEADKKLHEALKIAYDEKNEDGITYALDLLANLALDTGQDEKAEKLFREVVQRLLYKGYEVNDDKIIHISLKLGRVYENMNSNDKAELAYKYCIKNLQDKLNAPKSEQTVFNKKEEMSITGTGEQEQTQYQLPDEGSQPIELLITSLDNYGRFLMNQNRPREAVELFEKAYQMSVEVNGQEHENTALLLNDLGSAKNMMGNLDDAIKHITDALNILRKKEESEDLAIMYVNLGYLYMSKQMYEETKNNCMTGVSLAKKAKDPDTLQKGRECLAQCMKILQEMRK